MRNVYIYILAWALTILGLLFYANNDAQKEFDPDLTLTLASTDMDFDFRVKEAMSKEFGTDLAGKAFHFQTTPCYCERVAAAHVASVSDLLESEGYLNIQSDVPKGLELYVPSTPAIIMFDDQGELFYIGPYSSGLLCTAGNGFIEGLIASDFDAPGAYVINDAKGCYCNL